tara:strand:+ start:27 stop:335 length:309 start_codon:yes stop_codon:yes gene_type:complete
MDETIQKIYKCVESLWQKEFNPEGTEGHNMVTQSKEKWAEHYCHRLNFCDKYKPKLKTNYTESEIIRIRIMDFIRMSIIEDIKKHPGLFELVNKYYSQKNFS